MGNSAFYFYPEPNGNQLIKIDLGEQLAQLYSEFEHNSDTAITLTGKMQRVNSMTRERVTIIRDRMSGGIDLGNKLLALQNHLDRGHSVIFTFDTDKTWIAPIKQSLIGGDTTVQVYQNPFKDIVGSNIPAVNDFVTIETSSPGMYQEIKKLSSVSNLSATTDSSFTCDKINFTYGDRLSFARYHRCWVGLKRPQDQVGQSIVTNEFGILYSLNLDLVVDPNIMFSKHPDRGSGFRQEWITEASEPLPPERMIYEEKERFEPVDYIDPFKPNWLD